MKAREGKGPPATDLLVCFPSRTHLSLMPKPICSPARPSDSSNLHHHHRHHRRPSHHHSHLRKSSNRGGGATSHGSPLLWAKTKHNNADISEPTSPKVTCAGQIKVRTTKPNSCKNWQSVMEEIERLHNNKKNKKRPAWIEALGFKKEVMQFLTCLRNIRFDFRCFGAIPSSEITSDDEEEDDEDDEDVNAFRENGRMSKDHDIGDNQGSRSAVFSKWFMILQEENLSKELIKAEESSRRKVIRPYCDEGLVVDDDEQPPPPPPPPNALLLMRCRSAPAKSWLEEKAEEEEAERSESEREEETAKKTDCSIFSCEIGKEIRVFEGIQDKISRSRSCKR